MADYLKEFVFGETYPISHRLRGAWEGLRLGWVLVGVAVAATWLASASTRRLPAWLLALGDEAGIPEVPPFVRAERDALTAAGRDFSVADAERVKAIERTTNHDVKAVEYWLKERFAGVTSV